MRKINWKIVNCAFWVEILLSYVLPFRVVDNIRYEIGFPIRFMTVYNTEIGVTPLLSTHFNPVGFLVNGIILYFIISALVSAFRKWKQRRTK